VYQVILKTYFVIVFDKPFETNYTWSGSSRADKLEFSDDHVGAIVSFNTGKGRRNARVCFFVY
jgi:hypothetical protein